MEISSNGGGTWTHLATLGPAQYLAETQYILKFDIDQFTSSDTRIRFLAVRTEQAGIKQNAHIHYAIAESRLGRA